MSPDPRVRFMIFVFDRERKQKAQGASTGEGAMDLASCARRGRPPPPSPRPQRTAQSSGRGFSCRRRPQPLTRPDCASPASAAPPCADVEFQNSFAQLIRAHRNALRANRRFWRLLVHSEIRFRSLSDAFLSMDDTEARATRAYRAVLARYPRSVKILRAYGSFLEEVRDDPWGAKKHYDEAQKLDEASAEAAEEEGAEGRVVVNDKLDGVCVISQTGVIKVVNKRLCAMFGYRRPDDLVRTRRRDPSDAPACFLRASAVLTRKVNPWRRSARMSARSCRRPVRLPAAFPPLHSLSACFANARHRSAADSLGPFSSPLFSLPQTPSSTTPTSSAS